MTQWSNNCLKIMLNEKEVFTRGDIPTYFSHLQTTKQQQMIFEFKRGLNGRIVIKRWSNQKEGFHIGDTTSNLFIC